MTPGKESTYLGCGTVGYGDIGNQTALEFMGITRLNESTLPFEGRHDSSNGNNQTLKHQYNQFQDLNKGSHHYIPNRTSSLNTTMHMSTGMQNTNLHNTLNLSNMTTQRGRQINQPRKHYDGARILSGETLLSSPEPFYRDDIRSTI